MFCAKALIDNAIIAKSKVFFMARVIGYTFDRLKLQNNLFPNNFDNKFRKNFNLVVYNKLKDTGMPSAPVSFYLFTHSLFISSRYKLNSIPGFTFTLQSK